MTEISIHVRRRRIHRIDHQGQVTAVSEVDQWPSGSYHCHDCNMTTDGLNGACQHILACMVRDLIASEPRVVEVPVDNTETGD